MKHQIKYIIFLAVLAVALITAYQSYWLTDIYFTLSEKQLKDIREAMRSADFEEITHRVNILKEQSYGGKLAVSVGSDQTHENVEVKNEYQTTQETEEETEEEVQSTVPYDNFADALKDEEALRRVGLFMQKGIHDGLDAIIPPDAAYYDSLLNVRLDSLGISQRHTTLYLQNLNGSTDTLLELSNGHIALADTFQLTLNSREDREYLLLLGKSTILVPKKMRPALLFSVFTLLVLILAFWYIINMIRRMRMLDEMKSDFTNNITHELKTPIAVAYAANDALLNFGEKNSPEKIKKYLTISQEQLSLLTQLVEQILSLSMERRKSMKMVIEPLALAPIVNKLVENHQLKNQKPMTIDVDIPPTLQVQADKIHLSNIINNLIDNAIKYSRESIHLTIQAKRQIDGKVQLTIADNGIGISAEHQRYIFDKFYRVPHENLHNVKGYGLGLYYVKTMMEKLGGTISLHSEEGRGTTFNLLFHGED